MKKDFLDELKELALGSRLKRLSECLLSEASQIYEEYGLDIQPKWFTLLALLHHKGEVSVVEAAESLGLSQPAISQFCRQLNDKGFINFINSPHDSRRKLITLTNDGKDRVDNMLPLWRAVQKAAEELCSELDNNFYVSIQKCEQALKRKSLQQRTREALDDRGK